MPVKIAIYFFQRKCFWIFFFGKGNLIIAFKLRSESHRNFDWIFCAWLSKLPSKSLEEFCDDICFWSKELYQFFVLWHKTYRTFDGFFFQLRPNTLLSVDGNCLRMVFFDVFIGFHIFLNFELKCLDFAHEISTSLSKLLPNSLEEILDDNLFQERNNPLFIFGLRPKFLPTLYNDFSAGLLKVHLALLDEHFAQWKFCFRENTFSDVFWFGSTIFQNVCEFFRAKLLKILSRCRDDSVEQFCFELVPVLQLLSDFQRKFFWLSKKGVPVEIAFYLSQWKCFWIYSLWKINSIILLRLRSESHRNFDWIFCAWLSKLPSKSLEEFCDDICFWSKELYPFFVLWHKTYRTFDGFFFQFRPNTLLSVDGNCLRMVFFDVFLDSISFWTLS